MEIFDDRIEISNPGGLPKGLRPEDFGTRSVLRNPQIASLLNRIELIEKMGTGINKIRRALEKASLKPPKFSFTTFFTVVFKQTSCLDSATTTGIRRCQFPSGNPVIFFHGTGSPLHVSLIDKPAIENGFRIIAPARPGVSQSEFRHNWTVLEYAKEILELADNLGIRNFGIIGISGAGPTLMATACTAPERIGCVVYLACAMPLYSDPEMISHLGAMDRIFAEMGTKLPLSIFKIPFSLLGFMETVIKSPESFAKMFDASLSKADKEAFAIPEFRYLIMKDFQELFKQGSTPPAYDAQTVYKPWGFNLADIKTHIEVFHGKSDSFVPLEFSEYLKNTAKDVRINIIEEQGHFYHLVYGYNTLKNVKELFYYR